MERALRRLTRWLLRVAYALGPAGQREWLQAAIAESEFVKGPWRSLSWALGTVSFAGRGRVAAFLGTVWEEALMNRRTLGPIALLVIVLAILTSIPVARDAASIGPVTARIVLDMGQRELSDRQLQRLAKVAEQQGDASTMAFVAMHLGNAPAAMPMAKRAIALNPSLSWIEYPIIERTWTPSNYLATFDRETAEAVAADPGNALAYLLRAERIRREDDCLLCAPGVFHSPSRRREWEAVMGQAFSAPRYDDYLERKFRLERQVSQALHLSPFAMVMATSFFTTAPISAVGEATSYGYELIASGDPRETARAVRFGALLQASQVPIVRAMGRQLQTRGLAVLGTGTGVSGSASTDRNPWTGLSRSDLWPGMAPVKRALQRSAIANSLALLVQASLAVGAGSGLLVVVGVAALLLRRKARVWQSLLRGSAIAGTLAALVAFFAYLPFGQAYSSYLKAPTPLGALIAAAPFDAFYALPYFLATPQARVCFWWLATGVLSLLLLWRLLLLARPALAKPA
jgi:hypothetical protein